MVPRARLWDHSVPSVSDAGLLSSGHLGSKLGRRHGRFKLWLLFPASLALCLWEQRERPVAGAFLSLLINMPLDVALATWSGCAQGRKREGCVHSAPRPPGLQMAVLGDGHPQPVLGAGIQWILIASPTLRGLSIRVSSFVNNGLMTVTLQMNTKWLTCSWAVVSEAEESHLLPHSWFLLLVWTDVSQSSTTV